jgi:micrococcal nuclease
VAALLVVGVAVGLAVATTLTWKESRPPVDGETVVSVVDGDTITLDGGQSVRLAQVDAPELGEGECYSADAQAALASMLPVGTTISLQRDPKLGDTDRYGRLLRYVVKDDLNVNLALVRTGAASPWFVGGQRGRHANELIDAVRDARRLNVGLWRTCVGTRLDTTRGVQTGRALGAY